MTSEQINNLINQMTDEQRSEFVKKVTSDEYVSLMEHSMNQMNIYFGVFIGILGIVLAFVGIMQWRLNSAQAKSIKNDSVKQAKQEIAKELGKESIYDYREFLEKTILESSDLSLKEINSLENRLHILEADRRAESWTEFKDLLKEADDTSGNLNDLFLICLSYENVLKNSKYYDLFILVMMRRLKKMSVNDDKYPYEDDINQIKDIVENLRRVKDENSFDSKFFIELEEWVESNEKK